MRTLTLLSLLLPVALGIPLEQKEAQVAPPKTLQRPLVGDLLPAQGHVVEENPAPQPELGKELQLSVQSPDNKEQTALQFEEVPINVDDKESPVKQDLTEDNNEMKQVDAAEPFEKVSLDSELDEQNAEGLPVLQEPKAEMNNYIVEEDGEKESIQKVEDNNDIEAKYDFEQPIMKPEPQTDEDMQRDVVEDEGNEPIQEAEDHNDMEETYDFEQPIKKLEPLTDEDMQRDVVEDEGNEPIQEVEDHNDMEATYDFEQPIMKLEPLADEEMQRDVVEDEGNEPIQEAEDHDDMEATYDFEQPIMKLEPLADEDMQRDVVEDEGNEPIQEVEDHNDMEATYDFEQPIMKLEPLADEEMQRDNVENEENEPIREVEHHNDMEATYDFEQPLMKLEPLADEEMQRDVVEDEGNEPVQEAEDHDDMEAKYDFEQPIMKLEPLADEDMQRDNVENEENEPIQEVEHHNDMEATYDFEQPIMKLEPLADEDMQRDELLQVSHTKAVHEQPIMYLEPETGEDQFMNVRNVPDAAMALEEEGPMLDALGEPLQLSDEYLPPDEGFMRLEPLESEHQSPMMRSVEPVVHGLRSCSGVVLEGKCFQFFTSPKKASEAEYFCQQSFPGGHLASITSPSVHQEMMNLMRKNGGTRRTWVGGIRFLDTGRFVWLDGSHWGYADWLWGEPNHTANVEDCIEVLASGKFNDFTCWEPQAFICSYPYQ